MISHTRALLLAFIACLIPAYATAMVVDGGVISGLPPNTVVELDLGLAEPSTARTDSSGEVVISDEEDEDFGTLYIPTGSSGRFELSEQDSGAVLGALAVDGASIAVATVGSAVGTADSGRWTFDAGVAYALFDDLKTSVNSGGRLAATDGFAVSTDADDDAWGGSLGFGYAIGDGNSWGSKGSSQYRVRLGYTWYDDFEGSFTATRPELTVVSSGKQEVEAFELSVGYRYHLADGLGLNAALGYSWYDYEDSGRLVERETNTNLDAFSESNNDDTANISVGVSYDLTDVAGLFFEYRFDLDDTGVNGDDSLISFRAGLAYSF